MSGYAILVWLLAGLVALNPAWRPAFIASDANWIAADIFYVACAGIATYFVARDILAMVHQSPVTSHQSQRG